jgi:hypothetical protein
LTVCRYCFAISVFVCANLPWRQSLLWLFKKGGIIFREFNDWMLINHISDERDHQLYKTVCPYFITLFRTYNNSWNRQMSTNDKIVDWLDAQ